MQQLFSTVVLFSLFLGLGSGVRLETKDSTELEPTTQNVKQIRWPKKTIEVALSTSLQLPSANIKTNSDVVGAVRRAMARWSSMANINFVVTWSSTSSVSPASGGDGISLITIADTFENEAFNADSTTGRTRVFYEPETGEIAEADISVNPRPKSEEGADLQFSTDGTPGTYDLEATFTHEIGHLLGLDHSQVLASTMQSRQAFNGTFGLPALTERTLSEDDRQRVRSLYGPKTRLGKIEGRLADNRMPVGLTPLQAVNIWAENVVTGRVVASDVTDSDGNYSLDGLAPGQYRVIVTSNDEKGALQRKVRSFEVANTVLVKPESTTQLNNSLVPAQGSLLNPRVIGLNAELSTVAVPVEAGKRVKIYLGGEGIDQVPGTSIAVNSPYFTVDPSTLTREQLSTPFPVVSIEVSVAPSAPFGDYSIRLQANSGETAFVPGALTIDPAVASAVASPLDDLRFFISQQYSDLVGQRPDTATLDKLAARFATCGARVECLRERRLDLSTELFAHDELPATGQFLHGLYLVGLGRRLRISEFEGDRAVIKRGEELDGSRQSLALALVQKPEFLRKYSEDLKASEFVDAIISSTGQNAGVDISSERKSLLGLFDGSKAGRAAVLVRAVTLPAVQDGQYNQAFVLTQYFTYLRRDPDETGLNFWVNTMKSKPLRDNATARSMVCAFLNSSEYQERFGMLTTHRTSECN